MKDRGTSGIDHLVYAVRDLEAGMDSVERLIGVRAMRGGRHPRYGTHNALLALGAGIYLEIIAPDPDLPPPPRGLPFGLDRPDLPRLSTWALRCNDIERLHRSAAARGLDLGLIEPGRRDRPDGAVLRWKLTDPHVLALDGIVPFLIDWADTPHPASDAPTGAVLEDFTLRHPEPDRVREWFDVLEIGLKITAGASARCEATIRGARGPVSLT